LNWYNPQVREAIFEAMRFWLDRGVDGFRVDVMWHLIKDRRLRNNPPNPDYDPDRDSPYHRLDPVFSADRPDVHDVVRQMRGVVDEYDDRVLIGEVYLPTGKLVSYYGASEPEAHMPFNFQLIETPWDAPHIRQVADRYESAVQETGWPNWVLGNHDVSRVASRLGTAQARTAAVMQLTLRGTPTLYYGEELGMQDVAIPSDRVLDERGERAPGLGLGRDPERTPMPWSDDPHGGFTDGEPWLPLADDCRQDNVQTQRTDPSSTLSLYRRLIAFHHREPAIVGGEFIPVEVDSGLFAYLRSDEETAFLIILNLTNRERTFRPEHACGSGDLVISTHTPEPGGRFSSDGHLIRANEGLVVRLDELPEYYLKSTGSTMTDV
ncbi:MAG: alpha-amylase family glycosyl hydrolase, partial [Bradymonadaceae bacterium]